MDATLQINTAEYYIKGITWYLPLKICKIVVLYMYIYIYADKLS